MQHLRGVTYKFTKTIPLKRGFTLQYMMTNDDEILATIIKGTGQHANVNYEVGIGGTISSEYLSQKYREELELSAVASYSIAKKPSQLAVINGEIINYLITPKQQGVVIINNQNGKIRIHNLSTLSLEIDGEHKDLNVFDMFSDFSLFSSWMKTHKYDVFQSHLLLSEGVIRVDKTWQQVIDKRRVLASFETYDSFALIDFEPAISLYDAACLSKNIDGVKSVVNLDTGMYDIATFESSTGDLVELGTPDKAKKDSATNKIVFFSR